MREIVLENDACDLAEKRGWYQRKVQFVGVKGAPDRWFFRAKVLLIVEFKKLGEDLDGHQVRRKRELEAAGFTVYVIDNMISFTALLDQFDGQAACA